MGKRVFGSRLPGAVVGVTGLCAALLLGASPALASSSTDGKLPHPEKDHAGSTIRKHEGGKSGNQPNTPKASVPGMDVSGHQKNVDWQAAWDNGAKFAYVKATESTNFRSEYFTQQYNGSADVGMIRGAYHFATPNTSSGAAQANYFVDHGGGWSDDGKTLPPALDIEYNPYGANCYGKSASDMVSWIQDFSDTVKKRTGRHPMIYTTQDWWKSCTGNSSDFGKTNPLWVARYADSPGALPAGWSTHTIWQTSDSGTFPGDQDSFNGSYDRLKALAKG